MNRTQASGRTLASEDGQPRSPSTPGKDGEFTERGVEMTSLL
jgi:hypothetical protein